MKTIAQRLVDNDPDLYFEDLECMIRLLDALAPRPNATVLDAKQRIAEKFIFPHDPVVRVQRQIKSGVLTYGDVLRTVRPVALPMWMEWTLDASLSDNNGTIRYGYLVMPSIHSHRGPRIIGVVDKPNAVVTISMDIELDPLPFTSGHGQVHVTHYSKHLFSKAKDYQKSMQVLISDCIAAMFVLCTPRVASIAPYVYPRFIRRQHARNSKHPIIEFKTVTMHIGASTPHHDPQPLDPNRDIIHKRLHKVIGHYRKYEHAKEPHITYVPEHWRGDPSLGIVLHNRIIDDKEPTP